MTSTCQACFAEGAQLQCSLCQHARYCSLECQQQSPYHTSCRKSPSVSLNAYQSVVRAHGTLFGGMQVGVLHEDTVRESLNYLRGNKQPLIKLFGSLTDQQISKPHSFLGSLSECGLAFERFNAYSKVDFPLTARANGSKSYFEVSGLATYRKLFKEVAHRFRFFMEELWPILRTNSSQADRGALTQIRSILEEFLEGEAFLRDGARVSLSGIALLNKLIVFIGAAVIQPVVTRVSEVLEWVGRLLSASVFVIESRSTDPDTHPAVIQNLLYAFQLKASVVPARWMDPSLDLRKQNFIQWLTETIRLIRGTRMDEVSQRFLHIEPGLSKKPQMLNACGGGGNLSQYLELLEEPDLFFFADVLLFQFLAGPSLILVTTLWTGIYRAAAVGVDIAPDMKGLRRDADTILHKANGIGHPLTKDLEEACSAFDAALERAGDAEIEKARRNPVRSMWDSFGAAAQYLTSGGTDPNSSTVGPTPELVALLAAYATLVELMSEVDTDLGDDAGEDEDTDPGDSLTTNAKSLFSAPGDRRGRTPDPNPAQRPNLADPRDASPVRVQAAVENRAVMSAAEIQRIVDRNRELEANARSEGDRIRAAELSGANLALTKQLEVTNKAMVQVGQVVAQGLSQTHAVLETKQGWSNTTKVAVGGAVVASVGAGIAYYTGYFDGSTFLHGSNFIARTLQWITGAEEKKTIQAQREVLEGNRETFRVMKATLNTVASEMADQSEIVRQTLNIRTGAMLPVDLNLYVPGTTNLNRDLASSMLRQMTAVWNNTVATAELFANWATRTDEVRLSPLSFVNIAEGPVDMVCTPKQTYEVASMIFGQPDEAFHNAARSRIVAQLAGFSENLAKGLMRGRSLSAASQELISAMGGIQIPDNIPLESTNTAGLISGVFPKADGEFGEELITAKADAAYSAVALAESIASAVENATGSIFNTDQILNNTNTSTPNPFFDWIPDARETMDALVSGLKEMLDENPSITAVLSVSCLLLLWFGYQEGNADPQRNMFLKTTTNTMTVTLGLTGMLIAPVHSYFLVAMAAFIALCNILVRGVVGASEVGIIGVGGYIVGGVASYLVQNTGIAYGPLIATFGMLMQVQPTFAATRQIKEIARSYCGGLVKGIYSNAGPAGLTQTPPVTAQTPESVREAARRTEEILARAKVTPAVEPRSRYVDNNFPISPLSRLINPSAPAVITAPRPYTRFTDPARTRYMERAKKDMEEAQRLIRELPVRR